MKREFVINRHGKDYVLYAGLLDEAHLQGLQSIKTELVQVPTAQNGHVAICTAEVVTERGTYTGIGDADPANVNQMMANALIRMAETRAKARALRDAINVSMVAVEELAESAPETLLLDDELAAASSSRPAVPLALVPAIAETMAPGPAGLASQGLATPPEGPARPAILRNGSRTPAAAADPQPATQTQLETIAKLARTVGRAVHTEGLTRAAASELITRLSEERYGARRGT